MGKNCGKTVSNKDTRGWKYNFNWRNHIYFDSTVTQQVNNYLFSFNLPVTHMYTVYIVRLWANRKMKNSMRILFSALNVNCGKLNHFFPPPGNEHMLMLNAIHCRNIHINPKPFQKQPSFWMNVYVTYSSWWKRSRSSTAPIIAIILH